MTINEIKGIRMIIKHPFQPMLYNAMLGTDFQPQNQEGLNPLLYSFKAYIGDYEFSMVHSASIPSRYRNKVGISPHMLCFAVDDIGKSIYEAKKWGARIAMEADKNEGIARINDLDSNMVWMCQKSQNANYDTNAMVTWDAQDGLGGVIAKAEGYNQRDSSDSAYNLGPRLHSIHLVMRNAKMAEFYKELGDGFHEAELLGRHPQYGLNIARTNFRLYPSDICDKTHLKKMGRSPHRLDIEVDNIESVAQELSKIAETKYEMRHSFDYAVSLLNDPDGNQIGLYQFKKNDNRDLKISSVITNRKYQN